MVTSIDSPFSSVSNYIEDDKSFERT